MATAERTISSKESATIAANRGIPKKRAGCSLVMPTRDQRGLSQEMTEMKQEILQKTMATRLNTSYWPWNFRRIKISE
jgi:hypothetical protein